MQTAQTAWPFLIARSRDAGYRVVTAPAFLIDTGKAEKVLNSLARFVETPPGTVALNEVPLSSGVTLIAAYRTFQPQASDLGLRGDALLTDSDSRAVLATVGFVLQRTVGQPPWDAVAQADVDRAHTQAMGVYRRFWDQDEAHVIEPSTSFPLTPEGRDKAAAKVDLIRLNEPAHQPPDPLPGDPATATRNEWGAAPVGNAPQRPRRPRRRGLRVVSFVLGTALVLAVAGAAVAAYVNQQRQRESNQTKAEAVTLLDSFCGDLTGGSIAAAYNETTTHYRTTTNQASFQTALLGQAAHAATCTSTVADATPTTASGTVTVTDLSQGAKTWHVTLVTADGAVLIDSIAQ